MKKHRTEAVVHPVFRSLFHLQTFTILCYFYSITGFSLCTVDTWDRLPQVSFRFFTCEVTMEADEIKT